MGTDNQSTSADQPSVTDLLAGAREVFAAAAGDEEAPSDTQELTLEVVLDVIQNERRRRILAYLEGNGDGVDIGDLARALAEQEYDCPDTGPTSSQRKRMYVGLYQGHLPKMDDMDVVEFDKDRGRIEPGPHAEQVNRFLTRVTGETPRWPLFYLGLAALAGALLALSVLLTAGTIPATAALGVVLGLLVLTAVTHQYWTRRAQL